MNGIHVSTMVALEVNTVYLTIYCMYYNSNVITMTSSGPKGHAVTFSCACLEMECSLWEWLIVKNAFKCSDHLLRYVSCLHGCVFVCLYKINVRKYPLSYPCSSVPVFVFKCSFIIQLTTDGVSPISVRSHMTIKSHRHPSIHSHSSSSTPHCCPLRDADAAVADAADAARSAGTPAAARTPA